VAVSLQPPLIAVSLDRRSKACRVLDRRSFAVSILSQSEHELALHFAGQPQPDVCVEWVPNRIAPTICGALASLTCTPWATYDGGDHILYIGEVQTFTRAPANAPLLFHQGAFHRIGPQVADLPWHVTLDSPAAGTVWHTYPHRVKKKTP